MVSTSRNIFHLSFIAFVMLGSLIVSLPSLALPAATRSAMLQIIDTLQFRMETGEIRQTEVFPSAIVEVNALFESSQRALAKEFIAAMQQALGQEAAMIECHSCLKQSIQVKENQGLEIRSGSQLNIKGNPQLQGIRAYLSLTELSDGLAVQIIDMTTDRILFSRVARDDTSLDEVKKRWHLIKERERRERGESLSHLFMRMGLFPLNAFTLQVDFLEQWGSYNQHISGVTLSLINPELAIGASYRFMFPTNRKINVQASILYSLGDLATSLVDGESSALSGVSVQGVFAYPFSRSYSVFAAVGSKTNFAIGITMMNPILFPLFF